MLVQRSRSSVVSQLSVPNLVAVAATKFPTPLALARFGLIGSAGYLTFRAAVWQRIARPNQESFRRFSPDVSQIGGTDFCPEDYRLGGHLRDNFYPEDYGSCGKGRSKGRP